MSTNIEIKLVTNLIRASRERKIQWRIDEKEKECFLCDFEDEFNQIQLSTNRIRFYDIRDVVKIQHVIEKLGIIEDLYKEVHDLVLMDNYRERTCKSILKRMNKLWEYNLSLKDE